MRSYVIAWLLAAATGALVGVSSYTFWYGRGYSYLSDAPSACVNCHVMRDNFDSWSVSSHRHATCNDCHLPHDPIGKYAAKMENGFRHSAAFTFEDVQVIRIRAGSLENVQENCARCHEPMVDFVLAGERGGVMSCTRCHRGVGHVF